MTEDERIDLGWRIGWVYFIQCGSAGPIKIGWAKDPVKRLGILQTAQPAKLRLLGVVPGTLKVERETHEMFKHGRTRGEWFKRSTVINGVMSLILDQGFIAAEVMASRTIPEKKSKRTFNLLVPEG